MVAFYTGIGPYLGSLPPPASLVSIPLLGASVGVPANTGGATSLLAPSWYNRQEGDRPGTSMGMPSLLRAGGNHDSPLYTWAGPTSTQPTRSIQQPRAALSLSPASEPFPAKLVDRIRSGQFVEMRDLLADNMALLQQLDTLNVPCALPAIPGHLKPHLREITSLPSWMYCFLAYIAILAPDQPTRDRLAYARLIVKEALRHGGTGWMAYDRVFRQQAAIDGSLAWNTLHGGIQAATIMGTTSGPTNFCSLCREVDHSTASCALAYLQPPTTPSTTSQPARSQPSRPRRPASICMSWNRGSCAFPGACNFRHVCSICYQHHPACECPGQPSKPSSRARQAPSRSQPTPPVSTVANRA